MTSGNGSAGDGGDYGKGLALPGLVIGLLTGLAVYGIVEFWIDDRDSRPIPFTVLFFTVTASTSYLLLAETGRFLKPLIGALLIAALFVTPDYFMASAAGDARPNLGEFPAIFWFMISRSLSAYLLVTLVKASIEDGAPPPYRGVFFHGVTMPLIAGGAKVFAGLALVLLFAWARLLKEMDVNFFNKLFQEPWFILPFLGAIGGLSIALMRGQQAVLGALRYVILLFCRIAIIITAVFTATGLAILATKGFDVVFEREYPAIWMISLAFSGMLIFNGVYQNGEGAPPPAWLRIPSLVSLLGFPIYAGLACWGLWLRVGEYGLTPPRIAGLAIAGLAATYSLVALAGFVTELNWRARRWMPVIAPLNTLMAALWVVVLIALASPLANPWAMSAASQYARIADQRVAASEFDYGYLRFKLGDYGEKELDRMLTLSNHPEAGEIRDGVARARGANSYWEYKRGENAPEIPTEISEKNADATESPGPLDLEFNPADADTGPDDPTPPSSAPETGDSAATSEPDQVQNPE